MCSINSHLDYVMGACAVPFLFVRPKPSGLPSPSQSEFIMEEGQSLVSEPLLPTKTNGGASSSSAASPKPDNNPPVSTYSLISALFWILSIAALSIWAEFEASKSFKVTIINDVKHTPAGRRFALAYATNDEATRILLNASAFAENFLYPPADDQPKKQIRRVTLRLTAVKSNRTTIIHTRKESDGNFVVALSESVMENPNVDYAVKSALQRAMARVWIWDGESRASSWLAEGMAEYVRMAAGFDNRKDCDGFEGVKILSGRRGRWRHEKPCAVAQYLGYCEEGNEGYIRRLNQVLRDRWEDWTVGDICSIHMIKAKKTSMEVGGSWSAN